MADLVRHASSKAVIRLRNAALAGLLLALPFAGYGVWAYLVPHWPAHADPGQFRALTEQSASAYISSGMDTHLRAQTEYSSTGDYLNYEEHVSHSPGETVQLDQDGLPLILVGEDWHYSPGTLGNYSLASYGRVLVGRAPQQQFTSAVEKLLTMQADDGSLPTPFPFGHHIQSIEPGWTSAMDQGLALSAWSRAYHLTGDSRFLDAGERALSYMLTPYPEGPMGTLAYLDRSLSGRTFLLEFMVEPHAYTLNGNMFALLGLYDWWKITGSEPAEKAFSDGVETLAHLLPYYDLNGFSAYDLSHYTVPGRPPHIGVNYHGLHIAQLTALSAITGEPVFSDYAKQWLGDVGL